MARRDGVSRSEQDAADHDSVPARNHFLQSQAGQPKEFKSHKDLLDPKWKGKLILDDPRRAGPGQATFTFFYLHPELGPDFIRALGKQQITILKDFAQEVDAIGQGRYPVLIGTADFVAIARAKQGVPIAIVDPRQLKEGTDVSPANGALALFNKAPHPNAAKIYINWLLSKEGQTVFARASGYVSARAGRVPTIMPSRGGCRSQERSKLTPGRDASEG